MFSNRSVVIASLFLLSACVTPVTEQADASPYLQELPPGLAEMAGPNQDLSRVMIMPDDGCYWYAHINIVETTYLPLLTRDNRPICSRAQT
ncbi:MAG: hypothetical protein ACK4GT_02610 [Pararhodobacter sp.]